MYHQNGKSVHAVLQSDERRAIERGWVFDLDGVLINLGAKKVTEPGLLQVLAERLRRGELVTFNSGRSPDQAVKHILQPLTCLLEDHRLLQQVMFVGEKGGASATYTPGGDLTVSFDTRFALPTLFLATVDELIASSDFAEFLEIEQGKKTMLTLAMREGVALEAFQKIQEHVAWLLQHCLLCYDLASTWRVDVNGNCVEVHHRLAGKGLGAQRIISWLQTRRFQPSRIIAFGDSLSDLAMGAAFSQHLPLEFVFVGTAEIIERDYLFPITRTRSHYEQGTLEYLSHVVPSVHTRKESGHA